MPLMKIRVTNLNQSKLKDHDALRIQSFGNCILIVHSESSDDPPLITIPFFPLTHDEIDSIKIVNKAGGTQPFPFRKEKIKSTQDSILFLVDTAVGEKEKSRIAIADVDRVEITKKSDV